MAANCLTARPLPSPPVCFIPILDVFTIVSLLPLSDVKDCDSIVHTTAEPATSTSTSTVVGLAVAGGALCLLLVLLLAFLFVRRRRRAARERQLRAEELEEMLPEIVKRAKKDENFCKKGNNILKKLF